MRVLVAPQEFKGSLTAAEAAAAIAAGISRVHAEWEIDQLPFADGGPGFLESFERAAPCEARVAAVRDALGRRCLARWLWLGDDQTAVIEAAQADGLWRIAPGERDALAATSYGVGELIAAALQARPRRLVVGVGGSAETDGGSGMARALGARLYREAEGSVGEPVEEPGGARLAEVGSIAWRPPEAAAEVEVVVATDVTNPLCGPWGAARIFGPQKGASTAQLLALETGLAQWAGTVRRCLGVEVADRPGGGAAGGLAAGLVAFLGARVASGFEVLAELSRLDERLAAANLVVTGEGSFDRQSRMGKVTGRFIELAEGAGKPWVVFAGRTEAEEPGVYALSEIEPNEERAMDDAERLLTVAAARWAAGMS